MRITNAPSLAAFRSDQFRLLFGGLILSNFGVWMQQFAIGWLIVQLAIEDGRPELAALYLGLRSIAVGAASFAAGLFAGVYADRADRRKLLIVARIASAIVAMFLAISVITGTVNIAIVIVLSAGASAAFAFDPPGRQAILPNVVPARDLFSAMGLTRASMQLARTIGPLIAGILMVPAGVGGVLLAKAGLDTASIAALRSMRPQPIAPGAREIGVFRSLKDGFVHMRRDELISAAIVLQLVFALLILPCMQLLPVFAVDALHVGALELSWLVASVGFGALAGAVFVASSGSVERRGLLLLAATASSGALLFALGLQTEMLGGVVILAAFGIVQQIFMGMQSIILQIAAPDHLRGRVMGVQSLIGLSIGPVGVLMLGTLATFIGISGAFVVAGSVALVVAVAAVMRLRVIRDLRSPAFAAPLPAIDAPTPAD